MGQHLSEPVTTKETDSTSNSQYRCASSSMQGWRISILFTVFHNSEKILIFLKTYF